MELTLKLSGSESVEESVKSNGLLPAKMTPSAPMTTVARMEYVSTYVRQQLVWPHRSAEKANAMPLTIVSMTKSAQPTNTAQVANALKKLLSVV